MRTHTHLENYAPSIIYKGSVPALEIWCLFFGCLFFRYLNAFFPKKRKRKRPPSGSRGEFLRYL